jgi:4-hydroxythreonine-4-phosphate dehydrogenase
VVSRSHHTKPIIGITMGDYNGIGPEIILKALAQHSVWQTCNPLVIGSLEVLELYAQRFQIRCWLQEVDDVPRKFVRNVIPVLQVRPFHLLKVTPGKISRQAGIMAGEALEKAVQLCTTGALSGMVTAPVSKEAMEQAGYCYPGQTEMLAKLTTTTNIVMMLIANTMRVGLATVHTPLKMVANEIRKEKLREKVLTLYNSLRYDFGLRTPRIAVLGLNPHAGENGMFGKEELKEIIPMIRLTQKSRMKVEGPFAADGFFGSKKYQAYDAVLAMYHDQGLIPLKMMGFDIGVNFSAGLPLVRTSPDHGTAFDIAGMGCANPSSMIEAILLAANIIRKRNRR